MIFGNIGYFYSGFLYSEHHSQVDAEPGSSPRPSWAQYNN